MVCRGREERGREERIVIMIGKNDNGGNAGDNDKDGDIGCVRYGDSYGVFFIDNDDHTHTHGQIKEMPKIDEECGSKNDNRSRK